LPLQSAPGDTNTASEERGPLAIISSISIISLFLLFSYSSFGYYINCDAPRA
jgi:hypothetical protein